MITAMHQTWADTKISFLCDEEVSISADRRGQTDEGARVSFGFASVGC
jgi:hypothetical protein